MSELNKNFLKDLENYWHCEVRDASSACDLLRALNHPAHPISERNFKSALAAAIELQSIGAREYERITGLDFEGDGEVANDLRNLWEMMYGSGGSVE